MPKHFEQFIEKFNSDLSQKEIVDKNLSITISENKLITILTALKEEFGFTIILDITAIDYETYKIKKETQFFIVYILRHKEFFHTVTIKSPVTNPEDGIQSIINLFKGANWLERETYDQYGINFKNHPNLRRLLNHHQFVGHPLRKSYHITKGQMCTKSDDLLEEMNKRLDEKGLLKCDHGGAYNEEEDSHIFLNLGPSHPASHGTIRTLVALEGEVIKAAVPEIGYLHRGFEKSCENHTYNQIIPYTDRLNYCSALSNNIAFAKAVESMIGIQITDRAIAIRVMLMELSRIIDHLVCLAANLVDMGALTNYFYLFNPREDAYNFLSKLTGARLTNSYMRIGGMTHDLYKGWYKDLKEVLRKIQKGVDDTLSLVAHNRIFHDRSQNISIVTADEALNYGFTGPILRASGVPYDMRTTNPYYNYDQLDFDIAIGSTGDVYDRMMVRFEEITQSIRIIKQVTKNMPDGAINVDNRSFTLPAKSQVYTTIEGAMNQFMLTIDGVRVPLGERYDSLEAPNGELGFYIVSDGSGTPYKVKVKAPSLLAMSAYADMIEGTMIADAVINLGSLNIIAGEMDR